MDSNHMLFTGIPKFGFVQFLKQGKRFNRNTVKRMGCCVENCSSAVEDKTGVVRPAIEDYTEEAIQAVKSGKVIAVPTDTLYGFACDAWYGSAWVVYILHCSLTVWCYSPMHI